MTETIGIEIENIVKALGGNLNQPDANFRTLADLGLDSLSTMDLVLSVEAKFDLQIPDEKLNSKYLSSISTITALVTELKTSR